MIKIRSSHKSRYDRLRRKSFRKEIIFECKVLPNFNSFFKFCWGLGKTSGNLKIGQRRKIYGSYCFVSWLGFGGQSWGMSLSRSSSRLMTHGKLEFSLLWLTLGHFRFWWSETLGQLSLCCLGWFSSKLSKSQNMSNTFLLGSWWIDEIWRGFVSLHRNFAESALNV
jgi:hypothetical protein